MLIGIIYILVDDKKPIMKLIQLIFLACLGANCQLSAQQNIILEYSTNSGENIEVQDVDYYDVENKPTDFTLVIPSEVFELEDHIVTIDVHRLLMEKTGSNQKATFHYFKTVILRNPIEFGSRQIFKDAIEIKDLLELNKSRFYNSLGFAFDVCIIHKGGLIRLNSKEDCLFSKRIEILYGE